MVLFSAGLPTALCLAAVGLPECLCDQVQLETAITVYRGCDVVQQNRPQANWSKGMIVCLNPTACNLPLQVAWLVSNHVWPLVCGSHNRPATSCHSLLQTDTCTHLHTAIPAKQENDGSPRIQKPQR